MTGEKIIHLSAEEARRSALLALEIAIDVRQRCRNQYANFENLSPDIEKAFEECFRSSLLSLTWIEAIKESCNK